MSQTQEPDDALPRRDWFLLPLVVVFVIFAFLGVSDLVADRMFAEGGEVGCSSKERPGPPRNTPNCEFHYKLPEGALVEYHFNECGFRSLTPCGPKPPGTLRVVLLGTSFTMGLGVPNDETFAARIQKDLSRACRQPVEVENMGALTRFTGLPDFAQDALALSPDVIVLSVLPFDLEQRALGAHLKERKYQGWFKRMTSGWLDFKLRMRESKFVFAAQHFVLLDTQVLYETYASSGGSRELMSVPPIPGGERKYADFDKTLARLVTGLNGSGVPLIVMAVPNRVAAAMVSNRSHLEGTDPNWFGRHIGEIAAQHGALALDVTPEFAIAPHAERLFYPVDNHPTGDGHAVIAQALVDRLTDGSIPQLAACRMSQSGSH